MAATHASQAYRQPIESGSPGPLRDGSLLAVASGELGWQRRLSHLLRVRLEYQGFGVWGLRAVRGGKLVGVLTEIDN